MKVIIAGSRTITDHAIVAAAVEASGFTVTQVVSGCARGVDRLGEQWAVQHNIHVCYFPAHWNVYGASAGPLRNSEMAAYADALIAIWDGISRGTQDMITKATQRGLRIYVHPAKVSQQEAS